MEKSTPLFYSLGVMALFWDMRVQILLPRVNALTTRLLGKQIVAEISAVDGNWSHFCPSND